MGNQPLQRQRKSSNQLLPYSNRPLKRNLQCNNRDSQYNNQPKSTQLSNGSNIPQRNNRPRWTSFTSPNSESAITVLDVGIFNKVAFLFPVLMPSREATLLARSVARDGLPKKFAKQGLEEIKQQLQSLRFDRPLARSSATKLIHNNSTVRAKGLSSVR